MVTKEFAALNQIFLSFSEMIPNILGSLIILVFGWLTGRVVHLVVYRILKKFEVDKFFKMEKYGGFSEIFSTILKWVVYLVFIESALDVLGISTLSRDFESLVNLITGLLGGFIILIVAYTLGRYLQRHLEDKEHEYSKILSQFIFLFVMVVAVSIAFDIAGIPNDLINAIILIVVASIGLGMAIALGLGLKDTVARIAKKYEKQL